MLSIITVYLRVLAFSGIFVLCSLSRTKITVDILRFGFTSSLIYPMPEIDLKRSENWLLFLIYIKIFLEIIHVQKPATAIHSRGLSLDTNEHVQTSNNLQVSRPGRSHRVVINY
jgi:hypothetical protein